jgi:hypothetical protein
MWRLGIANREAVADVSLKAEDRAKQDVDEVDFFTLVHEHQSPILGKVVIQDTRKRLLPLSPPPGVRGSDRELRGAGACPQLAGQMFACVCEIGGNTRVRRIEK